MSNEIKNQTVTRNAQQIQNALDEISAMQMRIDSIVSDIRRSLEFKKPLNIQMAQIGVDLVDMNDKMQKMALVLSGKD